MNSPSPRFTLQPASLPAGVAFPYSPAFIPGALLFLDVAIIAASGALTAVFLVDRDTYIIDHVIFVVCFFIISYMLISRMTQLFSVDAAIRPVSYLDQITSLLLTIILFFFSNVYALGVEHFFPQQWLIVYFGLMICTIVLARLTFSSIIQFLWNRRLMGCNLAILGDVEASGRLVERLGRINPYFINVVGSFSPERGATASAPHRVGDFDALLAGVRANQVDDILLATPWRSDSELRRTVERLAELPVNVYLSSDIVDYNIVLKTVSGARKSIPFLEVIERPVSGWGSVLKTIEDYVIALVVCIILAPLLMVIALLIRLDSPGPVLFRQKRLGFNNNEFAIFKFRSMYHGRPPESETRQATQGDPRVTRVGRFIRATSLDELPQLFNILNGTMSLVGPRPHAIDHNEKYGREIRGYFARHRVKPGITGWAQVNGLRGETETIDKMKKRIEYDIYYIKNWSIFFDIKIIIITAFVLFFQKNAY